MEKYGIFYYSSNKDERMSDDKHKVEQEVARLNALGIACCVMLYDYKPFVCRCGNHHSNGDTDLCGPCFRGE